MSYEFKMQGVGNGKRSRLYKKTKRASMNKIDATHLPMRVQSDKGSYWVKLVEDQYIYHIVS